MREDQGGGPNTRRRINEPGQDLLIERCRINEIPAYRIRPLDLATGGAAMAITFWK